jgi:hypothetical protein
VYNQLVDANTYNNDLEDVKLSGKFDELYLKYLSKNHGLLTQEIKALGKLPLDEKKELGPKLNDLKNI